MTKPSHTSLLSIHHRNVAMLIKRVYFSLTIIVLLTWSVSKQHISLIYPSSSQVRLTEA